MTNKKAKQFAVIDAETDPFRLGRTDIKPFLWGFYDGCEYHQFETTAALVEFLRPLEIVVYAHNGGKFDYHFITQYIEPDTDVLMIHSRLSKFIIGACEFRDSYSILPVPLSAYQKDEIDYQIFEKGERDKPNNRREIEKYLKSDCRYLYDLVARFRDEHGDAITLASAAMSKWSNMSGQPKPKTTEAFYNQFFPYYHGGRVECFASGEVNRRFDVIDINSAYPYAMQYLHPYGSTACHITKLPSDDASLRRCFITLECDSLGAFPFRDRGLSFPNDGQRRQFSVTGHEYATARKWDKIHNAEIIEILQLSETISFGGYVDHYFREKALAKIANDPAGYLIAKLMLNSLYGKFAAAPHEYDQYRIVAPYAATDSDQIAKYQDWSFHAHNATNWILSQPLPEEKRRYYNIATGASITGFVRAFMFDALMRCENALYCDTDSIACESHRLDIGEKLGQWDIEAQCDYGAIAGKKLYAFRKLDGEYKIASKGVRLDAEQIIKVAQGETIVHHSISPTYSLKGEPTQISRKVRLTA